MQKRQEHTPTRVVHLTDLHLTSQPGERLAGWDTWGALETALAAIELQEPREAPLLLTGDLVHHGESSGYRRLHGLLAQTGRRIYAIPGNHDDPEALEVLFNSTSEQNRKICAEWGVLPMNSHQPGRDGGALGNSRRQRLSTAIHRHSATWLLAAVHHPPVSTGSRWLDQIGLEDADELMTLLAQTGRVRGLLCGHAHQAFSRLSHGIHVLCSPSTNRQFAVNSEEFLVDAQALPGYRRVDMHADGTLTSEVQRLAECATHYQARTTTI